MKIILFILCLPFLTLSAVGQIVVHYDIQYSDIDPSDTLQRLNLTLPDNPNAPLLIWIGGGAWSYVDKNVEMEMAAMFARSGFGFASIGHRLSPATWRDPKLATGVQHPAHAMDVARAIKWLVDHANEYAFDSEKIFIGGYSSGAHLAMLVALNPEYLAKVGLRPSMFKGVVPVSGTYDIEHYRDVLAAGEQSELAELHVDAVFGIHESLLPRYTIWRICINRC